MLPVRKKSSETWDQLGMCFGWIQTTHIRRKTSRQHYKPDPFSPMGSRTGTPSLNEARYGSTVQPGTVTEQTPNTQQHRPKISLGAGGDAIHDTLAIGGPAESIGSEPNTTYATAIVGAAKHDGKLPPMAIGGPGGGADVQSLIALSQGLNGDLEFGKGGNATQMTPGPKQSKQR
ncbi:hypothetical protein BS47DRAFT_1341717 [Hydnum rufescens UP504]|uniref:Uncharacterized protein n=1 Tax=Hydnum rufescens UP504 TaxID=1448309 RepID=A0A9P6DVP9_9AGAM|nr:hypothetical protein BS47DRAFT_1341717 [Hydnum rufescens UP504]